jgi:hypothetical protein
VELRVDSKSALALAKNPVFHEWNKHINTKDQLTDLLTKPLGRIKFLGFYSRVGMVQLFHKTTHKT